MTMKVTTASAGLLAAMLLAGCRQDMHNQPKFYPQRGTTFYADGRSVRPQVENTVARGQLDETDYFYTGMKDGKEGDALPFPATIDVLARGQERYNIYCTPCHSRVGNGAGMIVQRGYAKAGNFHTARLEAAPLGHFFNVITNGYGAMPDYSAQVTAADRWAIAAYIRALQLSQNAQQSDVETGQHVQPLTDIAQQEGFPANFAAEWTLPPTAVEGTTTGDNYVLQPGEIGKATANIGKPGFHSGQTKAQDSTGYPPPAYEPVDPEGVKASHPE
jgi:mono/diheme cytochrome c family protein